jgi:hypothetical protein
MLFVPTRGAVNRRKRTKQIHSHFRPSQWSNHNAIISKQTRQQTLASKQTGPLSLQIPDSRESLLAFLFVIGRLLCRVQSPWSVVRIAPVFHSRTPMNRLNCQLAKGIPHFPPCLLPSHYHTDSGNLLHRVYTVFGKIPDLWGWSQPIFLHQSRVACDRLFHAIDPKMPVGWSVSNLVPLSIVGA